MLLNEPANAGDLSPARMISELEAMIRRDGARQYTSRDSDLGFYRAQLCGVKAYLMPKAGIKRLYTPDTDITVAADGSLLFTKGNHASLRQWHRHLAAWQRAMRTGAGSTAIAA